MSSDHFKIVLKINLGIHFSPCVPFSRIWSWKLKPKIQCWIISIIYIYIYIYRKWNLLEHYLQLYNYQYDQLEKMLHMFTYIYKVVNFWKYLINLKALLFIGLGYDLFIIYSSFNMHYMFVLEHKLYILFVVHVQVLYCLIIHDDLILLYCLCVVVFKFAVKVYFHLLLWHFLHYIDAQMKAQNFS